MLFNWVEFVGFSLRASSPVFYCSTAVARGEVMNPRYLA